MALYCDECKLHTSVGRPGIGEHAGDKSFVRAKAGSQSRRQVLCASEGFFYCEKCWNSWVGVPVPRLLLGHSSSSRLRLSEAALGGKGPPFAALCVNLDRRADRMRRTVALFRDANTWMRDCLHRLPAVDGMDLNLRLLPKSLLNPQLAPFHRTGLVLNLSGLQHTPGAVGCALSHFRVWQTVASVKRDRACILVLEDDCILAVPDLREKMVDVLSQLPSDWDLCYVGFHTDPSLQIDGMRALEENTYSSDAPLRLTRAGADICGTFAYLLSPKGARRLLEEGVVFPLSSTKQLDGAISAAFPRLSVWTTPQSIPLFFSPQSQSMTSESDVQHRYYGPLEKYWLSYRAIVLHRMSLLDQMAAESEDWVHTLTPDHCDEIDAAKPRSRRRCIVLDFVDLGPCQRSEALVLLEHTLSSCIGGTIPVMVIWYGADADVSTWAEATYPNCSFIVRPEYHEEANKLAPGVGPWLQVYGPALQAFVSLQAFSLVELDQLLYLCPGATVTDIDGLFDTHVEADLYAESTGSLLSKSLLGAIFEVVAREHGDNAMQPAPLVPRSLRAILYNRRSWTKIGRWAGEMLHFWQRFRADLPCPQETSELTREALAANCALALSSISIGELQPTTRWQEACAVTRSTNQHSADFQRVMLEDPIEWIAVD